MGEHGPFAISRYEVTRAEFGRFVKATRYNTEAERKPKYGCQAPETSYYRKKSGLTWKRPGYGQTDKHPVVCVSVGDAMAYAEWLSKETGSSHRLPSAAEWQYAACLQRGAPRRQARAGSKSARRWVDGRNVANPDTSEICRYAACSEPNK